MDDLTITEEEVHAVISDKDHRLEITAWGAEMGVLRGPTGLDMGGRVPETLQAGIAVRLSTSGPTRSSSIFEGSGRNAGLEVVGDVSKLLEQPMG